VQAASEETEQRLLQQAADTCQKLVRRSAMVYTPHDLAATPSELAQTGGNQQLEAVSFDFVSLYLLQRHKERYCGEG
jgi:hypothetical protein